MGRFELVGEALDFLSLEDEVSLLALALLDEFSEGFADVDGVVGEVGFEDDFKSLLEILDFVVEVFAELLLELKLVLHSRLLELELVDFAAQIFVLELEVLIFGLEDLVLLLEL